MLALEELDPADLSPRDMLAMLRDALKLEREARSALIAAMEESVGQDGSDSTQAEDVVIYLPENRRGGPT